MAPRVPTEGSGSAYTGGSVTVNAETGNSTSPRPPASRPPAGGTGTTDSARGIAGTGGGTADTTVSPGAGGSTPPARPGTVTVQQGGSSTSTPVYTGTYGYAGGDGTYGSPRPTAAYETDVVAAWDLPDAYNKYLTADYRAWITGLARAMGGRSGSALWQRAIDAAQAAAAQGRNVTPYTILAEMAQEAGYGGSSPSPSGGGGYSGGGGGGGGSATAGTVQYSNRADISDLSNAIAQEMLGRGVTDRELDRIMKRIRRMEANNPTVVTVDAAGNRVVQDGASAASRQDVVERVLANNPEYMPFQKATTLMDWFDSALQERLARSGG